MLNFCSMCFRVEICRIVIYESPAQNTHAFFFLLWALGFSGLFSPNKWDNWILSESGIWLCRDDLREINAFDEKDTCSYWFYDLLQWGVWVEVLNDHMNANK